MRWLPRISFSIVPAIPQSEVLAKFFKRSGTDMTGRPGYRTMEMIGGSSASYLARTPCVPLFCTSFNRVGKKERFRLPGAGGGSFPLCGGTFARSYSVSKRDRRKMRRNFGEIFRRFSSFYFQGKWPPKKRNHEKSSTFSTVHQIKFFHCCNSGASGPNLVF